MSRFPLDPSGMWREVRTDVGGPERPALFIDRDGTIIELVEYLCEAERVAPIAGALESLVDAATAGLRVIIVTNQSGVDRGLYDWAAFQAVQNRLLDLVHGAGGRVDAVYACPALPESDAACRKPNPGMLLAAAADLSIDRRRSWIVGDSAADLEAGRRAGLGHGWLVPTGHGERDRDIAANLAREDFPITLGEPIASLGAALAAAQLERPRRPS
jgi:D-glycero-D-manno-heptose 1,7-bisphosphate phosphatase